MQQIKTVTTPAAVDAVSTNKDNTLEILTTVNDFYDSSWNKLIFLIAGAFTILGIILPIIIQFYQNKVLKASELELESKINIRLEEIKRKIEEETAKKIAEKFEELEIQIKKNENSSIAQSHHIQGNVFNEKGDFYQALKDYLSASDYYQRCDNHFNLRRTLDNLLIIIPKLKKEDIDKLKDEESIDIVKELKKINNNVESGVFADLIKEIISEIKKIK